MNWFQKWRKGQTMIHKTLHRKLKTEQNEPHNKPRWIQVLRDGKVLLLHLWHPSCYSSYKPCENHEWGNTRIM